MPWDIALVVTSASDGSRTTSPTHKSSMSSTQRRRHQADGLARPPWQTIPLGGRSDSPSWWAVWFCVVSNGIALPLTRKCGSTALHVDGGGWSRAAMIRRGVCGLFVPL
jgi:hypothetical protein